MLYIFWSGIMTVILSLKSRQYRSLRNVLKTSPYLKNIAKTSLGNLCCLLIHRSFFTILLQIHDFLLSSCEKLFQVYFLINLTNKCRQLFQDKYFWITAKMKKFWKNCRNLTQYTFDYGYLSVSDAILDRPKVTHLYIWAGPNKGRSVMFILFVLTLIYG